MTFFIRGDIAIPSILQIKQAITPFIQPYLKTLSKLEQILFQLQRRGSVELFCKGGIVNYLLFPAQPRPRDFDLCIRIHSSNVGLGARIKVAWTHVFRSEDSTPLEKQCSELSDFLLSAHQCGHFEIPSPESCLLPLDVTIAAVNVDELTPECTSSADAMEIPIKIKAEGADFTVSLELSPYAQYIGYQLSSVFNLTSRNRFFVIPMHAHSTRNGLFAYAYKLTQGKSYASQNRAEIESIYCRALYRQKKRKNIETEMRKYMKNHFSDQQSALSFLFYMRDIITRSHRNEVHKRQVVWVINSMMTGSYEHPVKEAILAVDAVQKKEEPLIVVDSISNLNQLLEQFDALIKSIPFYEWVPIFIKLIKQYEKGKVHSIDLEKKVFHLLLELQKTNKALHICELVEAFCRTGVVLAPHSLAQLVDLITWFFEIGELSRAKRLYKCIVSRQDEAIDAICKRVVQPQMELAKSKLIITWILNAFKKNRVELLSYAKTSLQQAPILQAHFINSAYPKACAKGKQLLATLFKECMEEIPLEDRFDFYQKINSERLRSCMEPFLSKENLSIMSVDLVQEEPSLKPRVSPSVHLLESISNLSQFISQMDALIKEVELYPLVAAFIKLIKKCKKGEIHSADLEKIVFYFLLELQKTNKALYICELVEALCRTGILAQERGSTLVDLITWFFERGDLIRAERLYKCIVNWQDELIETICRRVVQPRMELKKSKLIIKWILNAFKENRVELLAYAKISLQDRTLQAHFINSAYPKACIEGKKLLEALSIEGMEQTPSEDRLDFYQKLEPFLFNFSRNSFFRLFYHMSLASSNTNGFSACASRGLEHIKKEGMEEIELPLEPLNKIFQNQHPTIRDNWQALTSPLEEEKGEAVELSMLIQSKKKKKLKSVEKIIKRPPISMKERLAIKTYCDRAKELNQKQQPHLAIASLVEAYDLMKKYDRTEVIDQKQYDTLVFKVGKQYISLERYRRALPFLQESFSKKPSLVVLSYLIHAQFELSMYKNLLDTYSGYQVNGHNSCSLPWASHYYVGVAYECKNKSRAFLHLAIAFNKLTQQSNSFLITEKEEYLLDHLRSCESLHDHPDEKVQLLVAHLMKTINRISLFKKNNDQLSLVINQLEAHLDRDPQDGRKQAIKKLPIPIEKKLLIANFRQEAEELQQTQQPLLAVASFIKAYDLMKQYDLTGEIESAEYFGLVFDIGKTYFNLQDFQKAMPFLQEAFSNQSSPIVLPYLIYVLFQLNRLEEILDCYSSYLAKGHSFSSLNWATHCHLAKTYAAKDKSRAFLHFAVAFNKLGKKKSPDPKEVKDILDNIRDCESSHYHLDKKVQSLVAQVNYWMTKILLLKTNHDQLSLVLKKLEKHLSV